MSPIVSITVVTKLHQNLMASRPFFFFFFSRVCLFSLQKLWASLVFLKLAKAKKSVIFNKCTINTMLPKSFTRINTLELQERY